MAFTLPLLLGSAVVIYMSSKLFVNGVEWLGHRLRLSETATGAVLAAFGTALPESVVTLIAVAFGSSAAQKDIGVGAALGGPLVLSTLAYAIIGLVFLGSQTTTAREKSALNADGARLRRDQKWFLSIFIFAGALGLVHSPVKWVLSFAFIGAYALYVWRELTRSDAPCGIERLEPLSLRPGDPEPTFFWIGLQTGMALAVVFFASRMFVAQLDVVGATLGLPPQLTALLLSPVATEMPEAMNAIIWVRQGKERFALANIGGAMMIQATIPAAFGMYYTPWIFDRPVIIAVGVTILATVSLYFAFEQRKVTGGRLSLAGLFYLLFAAALSFR